jgi:hypothetical protein
MKNILLFAGLIMMTSLGPGEVTRAHHAAGVSGGFLAYGFYQPYGVRYSTSVRTPPYFALNPPVYYGHRYARPYGASPFASPPLLTAPADYQVQRAAAFVPSVVPAIGPVRCNPYVTGEKGGDGSDDQPQRAAELPAASELTAPSIGPVRINHFVSLGID